MQYDILHTMADSSDAEDANSSSLSGAVEDSAVFSVIDELVRAARVQDYEGNTLKAKYKRLHTVAGAVLERSRLYSKRVRALKNDVLKEKIVLEKVNMEEEMEGNKVRELDDEREAVQRELEESEQRDSMVKFELTELQKTHHELRSALLRIQKENHDLVGPMLAQLNDDVQHYEEELRQQEEVVEKENKMKKDLAQRYDLLQERNKEKQAEIIVLRQELEPARVEPHRVRRNLDSIERAVTNMHAELILIRESTKKAGEEMVHQQTRKAEAEELRRSLHEKLRAHSDTFENRAKEVDSIKKSMELERTKHHDVCTTKMELELSKREIESALQHEIDTYAALKKEYEGMKRQLRKKRAASDLLKAITPNLETQLQDQQLILRTYKEESDRTDNEIAAVKEEVDVLIVRILQQEGVEKDEREQLESLINEVDSLEVEVLRLNAEERRQAKLMAILAIQRDLKAREAVKAEQAEKETRQHVTVKELIVLDLTKRCSEINNRLKEFSALYDVVKNERNKYLNLIQSSNQALAEIREKIRILQNEVEILRNESTSKDNALLKERYAHQLAQTQRDQLRQDTNALMTEYKHKQSIVEQQIQEVENLNSIINGLEREMISLKNEYERTVEERNLTGVQLIDRNDELCILYEKSNLQQETNRKGEIAMRQLDEEYQMTKLQVQEYRRMCEVAAKRIPEVAEVKQKISEVEEQLKECQQQNDSLSNELEDPSNQDRWRAIKGEDLDVDQLHAKIRVFEDRLNEKREQLLEKELILEEVRALTEKIRAQAVSRKDATMDTARRVNELQCRIRGTTKKMLATVAELSMYQATALRLQQEKQHRARLLEEASVRLLHGEPPTQDAVAEWNRATRRRLQSEEAAMHREETFAMVQPSMLTRSTAEPRPNAYIADDMGLPKPYGGFSPFKPTELGSTMQQHIRAPAPKEIEI